MDNSPDAPEQEEYTQLSKSALKREKDALRRKVQTLVDLSDKILAEVPMSEELRNAITLARKLKKNDARRRQIQFIAKLLNHDDITAIDAALEKEQQRHHNFQQRFHKIEQYRDQLLTEGDGLLNQLVDAYPTLDRQHLRQLIRQAQKEAQQHKPPAASRKLFKYLQENII